MRRILILALLAATILPARAQTPANTGLKELLSGNTYPLTMKLQDLNGDWRQFSISGPQADPGGFAQLFALSVMTGNVEAGKYYTKGDTVGIGGEIYIVAYGHKLKPLDPDLFNDLSRDNLPKPEKLTPDTVLTLALLNLKNSGNLTDIRRFDLKELATESEAVQESAETTLDSARGKAQRAASASNLKQIGLALMMYSQDYDEVLPPMVDSASVKKILMPYMANDKLFTDPRTGELYAVNTVLSKHKLAQIVSPAEMAVFYEKNLDSDGGRNVAFADGHVKWVRASEWETVKKKSKIKD